MLPFLIADPGAFYDDTVRYGAGTYRIVGYGLSAILVRLGVLDDRDGCYPFALLALLTWVPLTVWLLLAQRRAEELWVGAARLRDLDPVADVHRPDLQQLLPAVAADGRGYRCSDCCLSAWPAPAPASAREPRSSPRTRTAGRDP